MLEFWSVWNLSWWSLVQLNILPLDYSLATSVIGTSIVGGFLAHIYPRRLKITYKNKKIDIPYKYSFWIDIFTHQVPLFVLYKQRKQIVNRCGKWFVVPFSAYVVTNYVRGINLKNTYGVSTPILYLTGYSILSTLTNCYHFNKIPRYNND